MWSIAHDAAEFLGAAGEFLVAAPVENTVLLTEAAYLHNHAAAGARFGWFRTTDRVAGAFLQAPRHPPVLSKMPDAALESLVDIVAPPFDVDSQMLPSIRRIWGVGRESRITLYRLDTPRTPAPPPGSPRRASEADRDRLVEWYDRMMAASPGDPSDLAYVVDDPLSYGGITLWEVDGVPVAMAGRSRLVAGMVRLGAVYPDDVHGRAAFAAAGQNAQQEAREVLVFAPTPDDATYLDLGFVPVLDRVLFGAASHH
jgi:hypothetical protein